MRTLLLLFGTVLLASAQGPAPSINSGSTVNAASYATGVPLAPGSIVAVYGNFLLGSPSQAGGLPLPTTLDTLSMQFGSGTLAPLFYVSSGQVNLQVPWEMTGQMQTSLSATVGSQTSAAQTISLAPFSPGIFSMNAEGTGQGAILDASYRLVDDFNPATAGNTVIQVFCTGLGPVTHQPPSGSPAPASPLAETTTPPTVTVGGVSANVLFSGLSPGFVGEYQVNALVPAATPSGNAIPVTISIGGVASNTVTMAVQSAAGTGTLQIQISGLPTGTPASVSVTSPNGYSVPVPANVNLQVVPGTYSIVANPVALGNVTYNAAAQQPVDVTAGSSAAVQVPYTTVIPNTTKILDQAGTSTLIISADGATLTLSAHSTVAQSLAPGDVLAAAPSPAAPHGLLRKIVSVVQAAGQVTATTKQATLADAIQQASVQFSANLTPQNIKSAIALRPGVEVRVGRRPARARTLAAGPLSAISPRDTSDICDNSQIVVTKMQDVEITSGLDVSGEIELCGNFTIQTSVNWLSLQLNSLTATATLGEHIELSMAGQSSVAEFNATQTIATIEFADIIVPVGPIPIDVVPTIIIKIGASGAIAAGFTFGVSQNASVTGGFSYANGHASPVLQSTPLTFQLEPLTVTAELTATAFVEADIDLLFYDIAGPYFDPQAYLQFESNVLQNSCWTLSGGLKGPVGLQLNPNLDVLGFNNLPTILFGNLFNVSQTFLQATGGCPSLQALMPDAAPVSSPSLTLTATGSNFVSGSTVNFNGAPLATSFVSPSELSATVPASDLASAGTFPVTVSNPPPDGSTSAPLDFTVQANDTLTVTEVGQGTVTSTDGKISCINSSGACSAVYPAGSSVTLNATAPTTWTFFGWSGACTGSNPCNIVMNSDLGVTATFTTSYTLTVTEVGEGTVTSTDGKISCTNGSGACSAVYPSASLVTLNATAATNWTFLGWSGACAGSNPCKVVMNSDLSATAAFTPPSYTLTVTEVGQGAVASTDGKISCTNGGGTCRAFYPAGSSVTLNGTAAATWTFSGWSGACTGSNPCKVVMNSDLSVTATFMPSYILTVTETGQGSGTVTSAPAGISCGGTCAAQFPSGGPVTLTATWDSSSTTFAGWGGDCSSSGSSATTTVNLNTDKTCTATFNAGGAVITNGSFEAVQIGYPFASSNPAEIPGWTHGGSPGDELLWAVGYADVDGSITTAGAGNQFVTLGGGINGPGAADWSTTITGLRPGDTYVLSFMIATEFAGAGPQTMTVVFLSGSTTASQSFTAPDSPADYWRLWVPETYTFVASASSAVVDFSVTNQLYDMGLDNVSIR